MPPKKASTAKKPAVKKTAAAKAKKVVKASPAPKKPSPAPKKASVPKKETSLAPMKSDAAPGPALAKAAAASPVKKATALTTIMVEACKQCQCFKKRFEILEKASKALKPGLTFVLNAEKPTKGVFIVRTDKGEVLWSMTGLTRPFQRLKAVDFEHVAKELVEKL